MGDTKIAVSSPLWKACADREQSERTAEPVKGFQQPRGGTLSQQAKTQGLGHNAAVPGQVCLFGKTEMTGTEDSGHVVGRLIT